MVLATAGQPSFGCRRVSSFQYESAKGMRAGLLETIVSAMLPLIRPADVDGPFAFIHFLRGPLSRRWSVGPDSHFAAEHMGEHRKVSGCQPIAPRNRETRANLQTSKRKC